LVPVPLLRNVLGVAFKVIELCEVSISIAREFEQTSLTTLLIRNLQPLKRKFRNYKSAWKRSLL